MLLSKSSQRIGFRPAADRKDVSSRKINAVVIESAYAYLRVKGEDLPLDEITSRMGNPPSESWRRGDPGTFNASRPDSGWCFHSPLSRSELSLNRHIDALLPVLESRSSVIRELGLEFELWIQCVGRYTAGSAGFHLSQEIMRRVVGLGLAIDVDIYFYEQDGEV